MWFGKGYWIHGGWRPGTTKTSFCERRSESCLSRRNLRNLKIFSLFLLKGNKWSLISESTPVCKNQWASWASCGVEKKHFCHQHSALKSGTKPLWSVHIYIYITKVTFAAIHALPHAQIGETVRHQVFAQTKVPMPLYRAYGMIVHLRCSTWWLEPPEYWPWVISNTMEVTFGSLWKICSLGKCSERETKEKAPQWSSSDLWWDEAWWIHGSYPYVEYVPFLVRVSHGARGLAPD